MSAWHAMPAEPLDQRGALEADDRQGLGAYRRDLKRYQRVLEKRRAFFSSTRQQKGKETKRIFLLSPGEDRPWLVFGLTRWRQHQQFVFETNGHAHWSALHQACALGDRKQVRALLLDQRIRVCALMHSSCGRIPLHDAVVCERFSVIRLLLRRPNASLQVHVRDNAQFTPMHYVLLKMQALARSQRKPLPLPTGNPSDPIQRRYQKLWNVADQLLALSSVDNRTSICELDQLYRGDLWDVCRRGDSDRFQLLCKLFFPGPTGRKQLQELRLDLLHRSLLHEAVSDRDHAAPAIVYRLVTIYGVSRHIQDASGCTALHYAAMSGSKELCVILLGNDDGEEEFDPEPLMLIQDLKGRTALHWSLIARSTHRADRLQTAGYLAQHCVASLFVVDDDGFTPLHLAIERGEFELVQQFIALGANVNSSPAALLRANQMGERNQTRAGWAPCGQVIQLRSKKQQIDDADSEAHADGGFGCRQFGGICQECAMDSDSTDLHSKERNTVRWWLSPLELAVHCAARLKRDDNSALSASSQSTRAISIIESLLLAGADLNVVSEDGGNAERGPLSIAVGSGCERLVSLLLSHGARRVSFTSILLLCGSERIPSAVKESILQSQALEFSIVSNDLVARLLPILFHRSCFATLTRLARGSFLGDEAEGCAVHVWSILGRYAQQQQQSDCSGVNWVLAPEHLQFLVSQMNKPIKQEERPHLLALLQCCLSLCLRQWEGTLRRNVQCDPDQHDARERVVLLCLQAFQATKELLVTDQSVLREWLELTIRQGLFQCALTLLQPSYSNHPLCWEMLLKNYDIARCRELRLHSQFLAVCIEKSQELLGNHDTDDKVPVVLVTAPALVYACAFDMPAECVKRLLSVYLKQNQQALDVLLDLRVHGKTVIQWIVAGNCVELATNLWQICAQTRRSILPFIWRQFIAAATAAAHGSHTQEQWLEWVFARQECRPEPESSERDWSWMLQMALRCDSSLAFRYVVDHQLRSFQSGLNESECSDDSNIQDQMNDFLFTWLRDSCLVHALAQWNAVDVTKYVLDRFSTSLQFRAFWSAQCQQMHPENDCTPIQLARSLGHAHVAQHLSHLCRELDDDSVESSRSAHDEQDICAPEALFGLFRSILMENEKQETVKPLGRRSHCKADHMRGLTGDWTAACALNQVGYLRAFTLHGHSLPTHDDSAFVDLLLASITSGAEDALAWLLNAYITTNPTGMLVSMSSQRVFEAASKHPTDVYARMTLLLLNSGRLHPGRLAGDGSEITLLHRAACFSNVDLAKQIITMLLAVKGSDINVLDAFGSTPLAYACYTGELANACFLMTLPTTRLEAEYEGQSCFYYTLHLLPSFSWRWIIQSLLATKRDHAFLHCQALDEAGGDTCACKGFEQRENETIELEGSVNASENEVLCGFCGHSAEQHSAIPYPSWFADQYDSYRGGKSHHEGEAVKDSDRESDDSMENTDRQLEPMEKPETIENAAGRLDLATLRRVTRLKYPQLLEAFDLQLTTETQDEAGVIDESIEETTNEAVVAGWPMVSLSVLHSEDTTPRPDSDESDSFGESSSDEEEDAFGTASSASSPWFMRGDLAKLHPLSCNCHRTIFILADHTLKYSILSKWLRRAALNTGVLDLQTAFRQWQLQLLPDEAVSSLSLPSTGHRCLMQWRYGLQMAAFRCWKRWRTSVQIVHHHVEEKADDMTAQMRRIRLQSLRQRQMELQRTISALNIERTAI